MGQFPCVVGSGICNLPIWILMLMQAKSLVSVHGCGRSLLILPTVNCGKRLWLSGMGAHKGQPPRGPAPGWSTAGSLFAKQGQSEWDGPQAKQKNKVCLHCDSFWPFLQGPGRGCYCSHSVRTRLAGLSVVLYSSNTTNGNKPMKRTVLFKKFPDYGTVTSW